MRATIWGDAEMSSTDVDALCDGPLAPLLAGLEQTRKKAVGRYQLGLGITAVLVVLAFLIPGPLAMKLVVAFFVGLIGWVVSGLGLDKVSKGLKDPAYAAICEARGMTFSGTGFQPDGYEGLSKLFGQPNSRNFSDRFAGEEEGRPYAFYEAALVKGSGKSRREVFNGLIVATRRRSGLAGETVVAPDKGLFNFFTPGGGMQRVKFEDDPEFEKKFEVYSTNPDEARGLINPVSRAKLQELRQSNSAVTVHFVADMVCVALHDRKNRFEAGPMMKSVPGRERIRAMIDDLDRALDQMRDIRRTFG